jgi:hypothetical protein
VKTGGMSQSGSPVARHVRNTVLPAPAYLFQCE